MLLKNVMNGEEDVCNRMDYKRLLCNIISIAAVRAASR